MAENDKKIIDAEADIETYADQIGASIEAALLKARSTTSLYEGASLADSVTDTKEKVFEIAKKSAIVNDQYGNALASVGTDDKVNTFTTYGFSADTLQWPLWLALFNDSWVFERAITKPATDMVASGFTLRGNRDYTKIYKAVNRYKNQLTDILKWGSLFGGSIGVVLFENIKNEDLKKPLVKRNIVGKRFKIYVTDRWYGLSPSVDDLVTDMRDIDFGKPKYYNVTMADGTQWKVHHSYVLRYEHRGAPNLIKNGYLQGWGYAEGSHIINELARDDQLKSSITSLVNKALIEVIKMAGMRGVFMGTDKGNEIQLRKRLEMVNWGRTYNSLTFLDKDDEYQQYQLTGLAGLADLLEKNMWMISAALEMQGVLFGNLKGGLSEESDAYRRYSDTIHNRCDAWYRPVLYKFLTILFIVYDIKDEHGRYEKPDFDFEYLDKFERNKNKVDAIKGVAEMLSKLEQDGIVSKYQYAVTVRDYTNGDNLNLSFSDEILNKLKLEEEQAILDTIKDISKKRDKKIAYNEQGQVNMSSPFTSEPSGEEYDETESTIEEEASEEAGGETSATTTETTNTETEVNAGESTNGEQS